MTANDTNGFRKRREPEQRECREQRDGREREPRPWSDGRTCTVRGAVPGGGGCRRRDGSRGRRACGGVPRGRLLRRRPDRGRPVDAETVDVPPRRDGELSRPPGRGGVGAADGSPDRAWTSRGDLGRAPRRRASTGSRARSGGRRRHRASDGDPAGGGRLRRRAHTGRSRRRSPRAHGRGGRRGCRRRHDDRGRALGSRGRRRGRHSRRRRRGCSRLRRRGRSRGRRRSRSRRRRGRRRARSGRRSRHRCGRRRGCRRGRRGGRRSGGPRRKVGERVAVTLRVGGDADAEVDVRPVDLGVAARPDRGDAVALGHRGARRDRQRAEMRERDREPVGGRDRESAARARHRSREGDGAARGRAHGLTGGRADVDAAVLPGGVRLRRVEDEGLEDAAARRPRPGASDRRCEERGHGRDEEKTTHRHHLCCPGENDCLARVEAATAVVKRGYKVGTETCGRRYRVRR